MTTLLLILSALTILHIAVACVVFAPGCLYLWRTPEIMIKKKKSGRRFIARMKQRMPVAVLEIPDEIRIPIHERQPGSVAVLICPLCNAKRYVDQAFLDFCTEAQTKAQAALAMNGINEEIRSSPRHKPCNVFMKLEML